jgi:hypothetical protein
MEESARGLSISACLVRRVQMEKEKPMQYAMLVYVDEKAMAALTPAEQLRVRNDCTAWHERLVQSGQSKGAYGLRGVSTAKTMREKSGELRVTDGPFAESKEVLGGFELIECKDLDEAIAISATFPALRVGLTLELRPIDTDP